MSRHTHNPRIRLVIREIHPRGGSVRFRLVDDSEVTRNNSGAAGWTVVDRPRHLAATQWTDYGPQQMTMTLLLDGIDGNPFERPQSVEHECRRVDSWEKPAQGKLQPPVLRVSGPVPHTDLDWVLTALDWGPAIRDNKARRIQQQLTVTLMQYVPVTGIKAVKSSPAKSAKQRQASSTSGHPTTSNYMVRAGDTLASIAAAQLGDYSRQADIAALNGIRDGRNLTVGQVLALPS